MGVGRHVQARGHDTTNRRIVGWSLGLVLLCLTCFASPLVGYGAPSRIIEDVRFRSAHDTTRVVIEVNGSVSYRIGRLPKPERIFIDLPKTRLASDWGRRHVQVGDKRLHAIRIALNRPGVVRVVLDLRAVADYHVFTLSQPYRIVIDLQQRGGASSAAAKPPKPSPPASKRPALPRSVPPTIVIDPGHGGKDPGAIGPRGLAEKTVVLQVAKALRRVMRQALPQYRVVLTRERDVFISLTGRAKIANKHHAKMFLSLHLNASKQRRVRGIETWYLSFAANERAKQTAARENNMSTQQLSELERILLDLQETDRINQSAILAGVTQAELVKHLSARYTKIPNRGVDGAPFMVLLHTSMPSILVEIAFVSNPQEEKRLRSRKYRQALAQGIFRGIRKYLRHHAMVKAE